MFEFAVNEPALFEFETITFSPKMSPDTRLTFPLLFVIITSLNEDILEFDVIPFAPEFCMYTRLPATFPFNIKPPFVFEEGASTRFTSNKIKSLPERRGVTMSYVWFCNETIEP